MFEQSKYGLSQETLLQISKVFFLYPQIEQVILYGSRAKGNFKPGADIDLTIKGKQLNLQLLNAVCNDLDDLLLPFTFDLSIYDHIENINLLNHIRRVGKVLYRKPDNRTTKQFSI